MKRIILLSIIFIAILQVQAQNSINTESCDPSAVLDISTSTNVLKGLLVSSMTTTQKIAITSPAHSLLVYDTDKKCLSHNLGASFSPNWTCIIFPNRSFFYMPSINLPNTGGVNSTIDLYGIYKQQYGSHLVVSPGGKDSIPCFPQAEQLYYYETFAR